jgi:hypothetical protein
MLNLRVLSKIHVRLGVVVHTCNPSYLGGRDKGVFQFEVSPGKKLARLYLENTHHKKGLVEWLRVWVLSSNPSTTKKSRVLELK